METIEVNLFWLRYGGVILTSVFWIIVLLIFMKGAAKKVIFLNQVNSDLSDSHRKSIQTIFEVEGNYTREKNKSRMLDEAYLGAVNENLKLKRDIEALREIISKKKEYRLRNGKWCTEAQYLAELNGLNLKEQLDEDDCIKTEVVPDDRSFSEVFSEVQAVLSGIDANESANKQIEAFLKPLGDRPEVKGKVQRGNI